MDTVEFLLAGSAILLAYLVRGVTGFGSALIAVPLLAQFVPLVLVVPWISVMDLFAALALTRSGIKGEQVRWDEIGWLLPAAAAGIFCGIRLLVRLERGPMLLALGLLVLAFGLRQLLGLHGERRVSRWWALPAGVLGGGIGAVFSTGGPPFVIYLSHRLRDKSEMRSTLSGLFLIEGSMRVIGLGIAGLLFQPEIGWYLLAGTPLMAAGLWAGHHVHLGLTRQQMGMAVGAVLIGTGGSLLWRVLAP